jgi:hypothetical protein
LEGSKNRWLCNPGDGIRETTLIFPPRENRPIQGDGPGIIHFHDLYHGTHRRHILPVCTRFCSEQRPPHCIQEALFGLANGATGLSDEAYLGRTLILGLCHTCACTPGSIHHSCARGSKIQPIPVFGRNAVSINGVILSIA